MDCSLPGSSVCGIFPGKTTGVGCYFLLPGDLPDPGIEPRSPELQTGALPSEPPGKPYVPTQQPLPEADSRIAVGLLLVALVVLHVEGHLAGLAVEACFMPELGAEAEGGHRQISGI